MIKKYRFNIGLTLLVQSASFVILFFMLYRKKKSLANTFLALSAIGGIAGAYLVLKEAKSEVEACEQAAKDAIEAGEGEDTFDFNECEGCYGDCSACSGGDAECEITIEEYVEDEPTEAVEGEFAAAEDGETESADETVKTEAPDAETAPVEEVVEEEPAEDIFTEPAAE